MSKPSIIVEQTNKQVTVELIAEPFPTAAPAEGIFEGIFAMFKAALWVSVFVLIYAGYQHRHDTILHNEPPIIQEQSDDS